MSKTMGRYCKAYLLSQLRAYPDWSEIADGFQAARDDSGSASETALTDDEQDADGAEQEQSHDENASDDADDPIVYLQEDYTVTHGVYLNENIIFKDVNEKWQKFCHETLEFSIPDHLLEAEAEASAPAPAGS